MTHHRRRESCHRIGMRVLIEILSHNRCFFVEYFRLGLYTITRGLPENANISHFCLPKANLEKYRRSLYYEYSFQNTCIGPLPHLFICGDDTTSSSRLGFLEVYCGGSILSRRTGSCSEVMCKPSGCSSSLLGGLLGSDELVCHSCCELLKLY